MSDSIPATKTCTKCGLDLPLSAFNKRSDRPDGHAARCRACVSVSAAAYRAANPNKAREWRLNNTERVKSNRAAYYAANRETMIKKATERNRANPEAARASVRRWNERNPDRVRELARRGSVKRRALAANVSITDVSGFALADACFACGSAERLSQEHLVPLIRGGPHSEGNLFTLCRSCNSSKQGLLWAEWRFSSRPRARLLFGDLTDSIRARNLARRT